MQGSLFLFCSSVAELCSALKISLSLYAFLICLSLCLSRCVCLSLAICLSLYLSVSPLPLPLSLSVYLSSPYFSSSLSISPLHSLSFLSLSVHLSTPYPFSSSPSLFVSTFPLSLPLPLSLLLTTQAFSSLAESAYELATPEDESEPNTYSLSTAFEVIVTKIMETADRSGLCG